MVEFITIERLETSPNSCAVLNGEERNLMIKLTKNKGRYYSGMNGYPPYWKKHVKILKPYI